MQGSALAQRQSWQEAIHSQQEILFFGSLEEREVEATDGRNPSCAKSEWLRMSEVTGLGQAVALFCDKEATASAQAGALEVILESLRAKQEVTLSSVLKDHLEAVVTSTDGKVRSRGVQLLAECIDECDASDLGLQQPAQVTAIATFMASRLGCFDSLQFALRSLLTLFAGRRSGDVNVAAAAAAAAAAASATASAGGHSGGDNGRSLPFDVPDDTAIVVLRKFFQQVQVQALAQSLRQHCYLLLESLLSKRRAAAVRAASAGEPAAVAEGFAEAMQGEKDPRCLLVCLRIVELLLVGLGEEAIVSDGASLS